jgi:Trk K+ transport system NAD-binding subunit
MKPLRDFFLVIFFIVLGAEMNVGAFSDIWFPSVILSLFVLVGNPLILYIIFRRLKFTRRNAFLAGVTAAQVSEFGFVLLVTGEQLGHLNDNVLPIFTMVAVITIFCSSYLILYNEEIYERLLPLFRLFGQDKHRQRADIPSIYDVWLVGHHRIGKRVAHVLKQKKMRFAVIDYDPEAIKELKKKKIPAVFGDIADIELLESIPVAGAKIILMTIPSVDDQLTLITYVRKHKTKTLVVANAYQYRDAQMLYEAGADYVMMPHLLGGDWITDLIQRNKLTKRFFSSLRAEQIESVAGEEELLEQLAA